MVPKWILAIVAILALGSLALLAGCGGSSSDTGGTGTLRVNLMDAPLDADEIYVDITSVQVHSVAEGWVTLQTFTNPLHVNLLDYSSTGDSLMLAEKPLKTGKYTMVRLMISAATIKIGGTTYPVDITNVTSTGVKCNGEFTVKDGELMALILDFNAAKSFVNNPKGSSNYKLHPVMAMSPVNVATEVTGTVVIKDNTGAVMPIPEGTTVDAYAVGHVGDPNYLAASDAGVNSDGTFEIDMMPQGTFVFVVTAGTYSAVEFTKTVTAPEENIGELLIQLP